MEYYIYGLYSTENNVIRYVGLTKNKILSRKNEHKYDALTKKSKNHKCNWIRSVYNNGYEIGVTLLEVTDEKNWPKKEIFWINKLKNSNKLVNTLEGGNSGGIGGKLLDYLSYENAKKFIKKYFPNITSLPKYYTIYKLNREFFIKNKMPYAPFDAYSKRNEWITWGDFFGTNEISAIDKHKQFMKYSDAVELLKTLNISSSYLYKKIHKLYQLPFHPERTYKDNWVDWYTFLNKN